MVWHAQVVQLLLDSGLFLEVRLIGGKVRATVDIIRYLDIHFDPTSGSYSYALIDLSLPYPGDKRRFGWDDFPHLGDLEMAKLPGHPHHFQERLADGQWRFVESSFRGQIENEIPIVLDYLKRYLESTVE